MMRIIDTHLGRDQALAVLRDKRKLLLIYNRAARKARQKKINAFLFSDRLAKRIADYRGNPE